MKIALVTSELEPLAGKGGRANTVEKLALNLEKAGETVAIFMPRYGWLGKKQTGMTSVIRRIRLRLGKGTKEFNIYSTTLPGSSIPVYLIDKDLYFKRPEIYGEKGKSYADNAERFHYFSLAVLESLKVLDYQANVLHCNDAFTAAIPVYLKQALATHKFYQSIASVLSIHDANEKGEVTMKEADALGLDLIYDKIPAQKNGQFSFLEEGKKLADKVITENLSDAKTAQEAYQSTKKKQAVPA